MKHTTFEELPVWQKARKFAKLVFELTSVEPFTKDFRLRDQIRASSGSVMDNIAEGFEREGTKEFMQFLYIAKASCGEARSQCYRAFDFQYLTTDQLNILLNATKEISADIANFIKYLKKSGLKGSKFS
jgi:four helix bundle protein